MNPIIALVAFTSISLSLALTSVAGYMKSFHRLSKNMASYDSTVLAASTVLNQESNNLLAELGTEYSKAMMSAKWTCRTIGGSFDIPLGIYSLVNYPGSTISLDDIDETFDIGPLNRLMNKAKRMKRAEGKIFDPWSPPNIAVIEIAKAMELFCKGVGGSLTLSAPKAGKAKKNALRATRNYTEKLKSTLRYSPKSKVIKTLDFGFKNGKRADYTLGIANINFLKQETRGNESDSSKLASTLVDFNTLSAKKKIDKIRLNSLSRKYQTNNKIKISKETLSKITHPHYAGIISDMLWRHYFGAQITKTGNGIDFKSLANGLIVDIKVKGDKRLAKSVNKKTINRTAAAQLRYRDYRSISTPKT